MIFSKRRKFILVSLLLAWLWLAVQFVGMEYRYAAILGLAAVSYLLSAWSLKEDLDGIEWLGNLILPAFFLPSLALFNFLLPEGLILRLLLVVLAAIGQYGILLSSNIFSVAIIRTIQLARAAQAVMLLFTLAVAFFLFDSLFSYKLTPLANGLVGALVVWPLAFQSLWVNKLDKHAVRALLGMAAMVSLLLGECAWMISHWPVNIIVASLWLVSILYVLLSLLHYDFSGRLFPNTATEYVRIGLIMLILMFITASWN